MGIFESISDFVSKIGDAISNVMKSSSLIQTILPVLSVVIPPPYDIIALIAITVIAAAMGVEEEPEKLGWQMNEADKKPEDFESFKEYKQYLDEKFPFDEDKFNAMTAEQTQACRYVGMIGTVAELKENTGFEVPFETLGLLLKGKDTLGWSNETMGEFAKNASVSLKEQGLNSLSPIGEAIKGTLDPDDFGKVVKSIDAALKDLPKSNVSEAFEVIAALKDNANA